ncbi:hypothetical protein Btru_026518 [Bulinus truncatus]|nr:hypothetical protein Btru_026518 [Bulinus truncatus]
MVNLGLILIMEHSDASRFLHCKRTENAAGNSTLPNGATEKVDRPSGGDFEYDPIYEVALQFAKTHRFGYVIFEDDQPKRTRKKNLQSVKKYQRRQGRTTYNTFLPHTAVSDDRKCPVHVVRYTSALAERSRRKCKNQTTHVMECVVNDMKLIESAKKDIDMVRRVSTNLSRLDVVVPTSADRPPSASSCKVQRPIKRRSRSRSSAASPNRASASATAKVSVSHQSLEYENRRLSPPDDTKVNVRMSSTTDTILSSAPLEDYKEYLSDICIKIFQEQPNSSPNVTKLEREASDIRKCAEGDTGGVDVDAYDKEKSPVFRQGPSPGRSANFKLKTKKAECLRADFLKKYYTKHGGKSEENRSLNNAPNDDLDVLNAMHTDVFDTDSAGTSKIAPVSSLARSPDYNDKTYRLCSSISATVFQETLLTLRPKMPASQACNLPVSKIDFVRVKTEAKDADQEVCRAARRSLHSIPRPLKFVCDIVPHHHPIITRIRCNPHQQPVHTRSCDEYRCPPIYTSESCHNLFPVHFGCTNRMAMRATFFRLEADALCRVARASACGEACSRGVPDSAIVLRSTQASDAHGIRAVLSEDHPTVTIEQVMSTSLKEGPFIEMSSRSND